jgi:hypothetical protein
MAINNTLFFLGAVGCPITPILVNAAADTDAEAA